MSAYAALAEVCVAFAAFSRASLARSCDSVSCTWLSKTYCAGRWFSIGISGAIGPLVLIPRQAIASALSGMLHHGVGRGRLVAAMRHAVRAFFVAAGAVGVPVGGLHQFRERLGVAFAEQVARLLPAEDVARRHAPRRAVEFLVAGEEVQKHAGMGQVPVLALAEREDVAEQLLGLAPRQEMLLVGRPLIA